MIDLLRLLLFVSAGLSLVSCRESHHPGPKYTVSRVKHGLNVVKDVINNPDSQSRDAYDLYDRFSPKHTLKLRASDGVLYMYSIGPDKVDDLGLIVYDPTNGTVSAGDIVEAVFVCSTTATENEDD